MQLPLDAKEKQRQQAAAALHHALQYLEQDAQEHGFKEIALLIGCAKMALDDELGVRAAGEQVH
ncbi:MAG TPA: hypothetical protein VLL76_05915 [Candidatus Omnitrophota bacterium]|nr:hypothetical protein [Candidatus Omnitrophota bacterium]